jgi:ribosomal protein L37AE/L43A
MGFEDDPKDEIQSFPCDFCESGNVAFNKDTGCWECDNCDFAVNNDNGI